jgi:hypothetical protein
MLDYLDDRLFLAIVQYSVLTYDKFVGTEHQNTLKNLPFLFQKSKP